MKIYEENVRESLINYLKEQGIQDIGKEVLLPDDWRYVDLVYIDKRRKFVCVEVKLTDYKKVIEQAQDCLKYTPLSYVAMPVPENYMRKADIEVEVARAGLGLMWMHPDGKWTVQYTPKRIDSKKGDRYFNSQLKQSLYSQLHITFMGKCVKYHNENIGET